MIHYLFSELLDTTGSGLFIAIVGGVIVHYLIALWDRRQREKHLINAFKAEITSIIKLIKRGRYDEILDNMIVAMKTQNKEISIFGTITREYYTRVYDANVSDLGLLPEKLATDIVKFYTGMSALIDDFKTCGDKSINMGVEQRTYIYLESKKLMAELRILGTSVLEHKSKLLNFN